MSRVLIADVSYLMFRSFFGYPNLTVKIETENGLETLPIGAFFGFAKTILTIIKNYQIDELILAGDSPFPTWRHEAHDNYKSGRKEMDENLRVQIPLINDWCKQITKNFLSVKGLEADDLIASAVINLNLKLQNPKSKLQKKLPKTAKIREIHQEIEKISQTPQTPEPEKKIEEKILENIDKIGQIGQNKIGKILENELEAQEIDDKMANFLDFRDQYFWEKNLNNVDKTKQTVELTNQNQTQNEIKEIDETLPNLDKKITNLITNITELIQIDEDSKLFIYSKDRDLFQLLVFENVFFVENESNFQVFGQKEFERKYELKPDQWLCYKTLVGDSSDKLDGIAGIGPKTATQILQKYKSVANFVNCKIHNQNCEQNDKSSFNSAKTEQTKEKIKGILDKKFDEKLNKWQGKIDLEKIAKIRRLSSLCWINLELESGFELQNGLEKLIKYKFGSLINMQNQITKNKIGKLEGFEKQNFNQKTNAKKQNSQIQMEDLF